MDNPQLYMLGKEVNISNQEFCSWITPMYMGKRLDRLITEPNIERITPQYVLGKV